MTKYKVLLRPELKTVEINSDQNLLAALRQENIYVKSTCGGNGTCADCMVKVVSGEEHLSPMAFAEIKMLGNVFHITKERLACQTTITGDITLDIAHHNKSQDQQKLKKKTHSMGPKKKHNLRKKSVVEQIKEEREHNIAQSKKDESPSPNPENPWFKHWEKKEGDATLTSRVIKKLGGGKRPRPFNYDSEDES